MLESNLLNRALQIGKLILQIACSGENQSNVGEKPSKISLLLFLQIVNTIKIYE